MNAKRIVSVLAALSMGLASLSYADSAFITDGSSNSPQINHFTNPKDAYIGPKPGQGYSPDGLYFFGVTYTPSNSDTVLLANDRVTPTAAAYADPSNMSGDSKDPWGWKARAVQVTGGQIAGVVNLGSTTVNSETSTNVHKVVNVNGKNRVQLWPFAQNPVNNVYKGWFVHYSNITLTVSSATTDLGNGVGQIKLINAQAALGNGPNYGAGLPSDLIIHSASYPNADGTSTDNFTIGSPEVVTGSITATKFFDTNADGTQNNGEVAIPNWLISLDLGGDFLTLYTDANGQAIFNGLTIGSTYTVFEDTSLAGWYPTGPASKDVLVTGSTSFGNVQLGGIGGLTLGFWSNKNGQALTDATDLAVLVALNLRNANGSDFDPTALTLAKWLTGASATNMANMLSAQLAAVQLSLLNSGANSSLTLTPTTAIYAPKGASAAQDITPAQFAALYAAVSGVGPNNVNAFGFTTVAGLIAQANAALALPNNITTGAGPMRDYQQALKNALDGVANNKNIVGPVVVTP
jgi:hypothetical protein